MTIALCQVIASDVLDVEVLGHGRAGVWFLNWALSTKPIAERKTQGIGIFSGSGIYALCFDDSLIYIGSYLGDGKKIANFSGDVITSRWWTHIGAITARGSRVHIARKSLASLSQDLGVKHEMVAGFINASEPELLHMDNGDLSPLRRLKFAAQHSRDFLDTNADPAQILKRFTFVYARYEILPPNLSATILTTHIENAEIKLIERLAPSCNTKHVPRGKAAINVHLKGVAQLLQNELNIP